MPEMPGSSLVFSTGIEVIDFTVQRTIDRIQIDRVTFDFLNDRIQLRLQKGFIDPETSEETFVNIAQTLTIENLTSEETIVYDGRSYTIPTGTHFDDIFDGTSTETLGEHIEDAIFTQLEVMGIFSGTETDL
jgi:hypothetical protein